VNPAAAKPFCNARNDLDVHRNNDIGSPRVAGATNTSKACSIPGCAWRTDRRPAPGARTRPSATAPARTSRNPIDTRHTPSNTPNRTEATD
jgi:hypothetical protein